MNWQKKRKKGIDGMRKEDFKNGQTVWVYLVGNAARRVSEDKRIEEWEVVSVGRRYITAKPISCSCPEVKFDMENNFRQKYNCCQDYILFLQKEDIEKYLWKNETIRYIERSTSIGSGILPRMDIDDLKIVYDIFRKYDK